MSLRHGAVFILVGQLNEPMTHVSEKVRAFYERIPYPPPFTTLDEHRDLYRNPDRRRVQFHLLWPTKPMRNDQQILIAGCGTSQAARYALREPEARVTAIDISEISLGYTRKLKEKYNLENLEIHQLAIEDVAAIRRSFDQIVCTGVLHHLQDPDVGLCALRDVLSRDGAMNLMVYAPYGRAGIYMMQEYCRLLGISSSDEDLRELSSTLQALPLDHPLSGVLRGAKDFRHPEALADALLHPLDRAYTVQQLYDWLERCGMSFGRWVEQACYLPQCGIIAKTRHARSLESLPPRLQHAAVELFRGTMVRHKFIAYRDDLATPSQPISFVGDEWRDYVPIRVPWTITLRERVPQGRVAVLINRAHPFTDLILSINSCEDRLLAAIDGKRTLGEILRITGNDCDHCSALNFFERLWQYDQIALDASRAAHES